MKPGETEHSSLDRLNDTERDLLSLLGRGHTAKSIATLTGLSVAAVNERFRNARRKTGLASSREIARLVIAQENRHDFIGLADPAVVPSTLPRSGPASRRWSFRKRWRLPMLAAALVAAVLLAQQTSTPPTLWQDGLAGEILSRQTTVAPDMADLNHQVSTGARDTHWSPEAETILTSRYNGVSDFGRDVRTFSLRCAADLCEVSGIMRPDISGDELTDLMIALQTLGTPDPVPGLDQVIHHFSTSGDTPPAFVSYWGRRA